MVESGIFQETQKDADAGWIIGQSIPNTPGNTVGLAWKIVLGTTADNMLGNVVNSAQITILLEDSPTEIASENRVPSPQPGDRSLVLEREKKPGILSLYDQPE